MHITTLGYALLALLARQSSSGYDLARRLKRPIGFFWSANQSHIYSELTRLEAHGLIMHEMIEQANRPDKKLFHVTDAGLTVLREWVTQPYEPAPPRDELALKAYAIWLADPDQALLLFRQQEDYHATQLAEYQQILAQMEQRYGPTWEVTMPAFGSYATLHAGIGYEQASIAWCRWMAEQFERFLQQQQQQE